MITGTYERRSGCGVDTIIVRQVDGETWITFLIDGVEVGGPDIYRAVDVADMARLRELLAAYTEMGYKLVQRETEDEDNNNDK